MTKECYITSLRLRSHTREEAPEVVHCVEARTKTEEVEELELNLRTNGDNQVKPTEEMSTF